MWWVSVLTDTSQSHLQFTWVRGSAENYIFLHFSFMYVSRSFSLVYSCTFLLVCMFPIVVIIDLPYASLLTPLWGLAKSWGHLFILPWGDLLLSGYASSDLVVWSRMLFTTIYDCCVSRGTYQIPVCLFLVHFIICFPFLDWHFLIV